MTAFHHEPDCDGMGCDNGRVLLAFDYEQCCNCISIRDRRAKYEAERIKACVRAAGVESPHAEFCAYTLAEEPGRVGLCFEIAGKTLFFRPEDEVSFDTEGAGADNALAYDKAVHDSYRRRMGLDD